MNNSEKVQRLFSEALGIDVQLVKDDLRYNTIPQWDSVAHMQLIATLEKAFEVMFDTDDIIDMSSVAKARELLAKHGVAF